MYFIGLPVFNMAELKGKYAPYFDLVVDGDKKKP